MRVTPTRTEIIILATRTQNVLGDKGRRIRELTAVIQKRFNFAVSQHFSSIFLIRFCLSNSAYTYLVQNLDSILPSRVISYSGETLGFAASLLAKICRPLSNNSKILMKSIKFRFLAHTQILASTSFRFTKNVPHFRPILPPPPLAGSAGPVITPFVSYNQ